MAAKKTAAKKSTRSISGMALVGILAFFVALWLLWDTPFVAPLKLFVVFLH